MRSSECGAATPDDAATAPPDRPFLESGEITRRAGLLARRRLYWVYIGVEDFDQFRNLYEKVALELHAWGSKQGKKYGGIRIHIVMHPWIEGRVREYIRKLRNSSSHAFMRGGVVEVQLTGIDGSEIAAYTLEPDA